MLRHLRKQAELFLEFIGFTPRSFLMLIIAVIICVSFVTLAFNRTHQKNMQSLGMMTQKDACMKMDAKVKELRAKRDALLKKASGETTEEELQTLTEELINARKNWVNECQSALENDEFYTKLEREFSTAMAASLAETIKEESLLAEKAMQESAYEKAALHYKLAKEAQLKINSSYPISEQASPHKLTSLERKELNAQMTPIVAPYKELKHRADNSFYDEDYIKARSLYMELRTLLANISPKVPKSYMDCELKTNQANNKINECSINIRTAEIKILSDNAQKEAEKGNYKQAADIFLDALSKQRQMERDFPSTYMFLNIATANLEQLRQDTLAGEYRTTINNKLVELDKVLNSNDHTQAKQLILELNLAAGNIGRLYPDAEYLNDENVERIRFLYALGDDLPNIYRSLCSHLIPVKGSGGWKMMDREVSQFLFEKICSSNPSLQKGKLLPVEGITLEEAREFAKKARWISGMEARLPDLETFTQLAKAQNRTQIRANTWNSITSPQRKPHDTGSSKADINGFYDLLGNVSEWVEENDYNTRSLRGFSAGGSVRDNPIRLSEIPVQKHKSDERVRNTGLRLMLK